MDKKALRNKRNKYHASRTHERPNQGILDRVASKVKGWFSNVWTQAAQEEPDGSDTNEESPQKLEFSQQAKTFSSKRPRLRLQDNSLSQCSSSSLCLEPPKESNFTSQTSSRGIKRLRLHEHSIPSCSMGIFNEMPCEQDLSQNSIHSNKRQRLRLPEDSSILSDTQSWLEVPNRPNIFGQASHVPSNNVQRQLIESKESSIILNGDDHSENSEGSASTSGCSSLVSHKDRANCISSRILGESETKGRRNVTSQKESTPGNINSTRMSLWSTTDRSEARSIRSPSLLLSGQPSFSLSAFSSPSKLNYQVEKRVASPFYQGKTTFGGASASRRMPIAAAPYQTEKPLRNQIKFLSSQSKDSYEGMSSAAKRILQTLEKMSSPVIDAKKIPNTNKSPVDLSLYLMPPKCHKILQSTPAGPTKGPPIADISTISKLTTIKNYGQKTFQNTLLDSPSLLNEEPCSVINSILSVPQTTTVSPSLPSGGGKMRTKRNQQHRPSAKDAFATRMSDMESRMSEYIDAIGDTADLPEISLPISSLPTITFGSNTVKSTSNSNQNGKDFVFSNPIEHLIPKTALANACPSVLTYNFLPPLTTSPDRSEDNNGNKFTFSNPIELEVPISSSSSSSSLTSDINVTKASSQATWKCNSCWIQNPANETKCMCCETPNTSKEKITAEVTVKETFSQTSKPSFAASTWECSSCWVRNPADKSTCLACEAPNPSRKDSSGGVKSSEQTLMMTSSGFKFSETSNAAPTSGFVFGAFESSKSTQNSVTGFKIPTAETKAQTVSFGNLKIPVNKSSSSELQNNKSTSATNTSLKSSPSLTALAKNTIPESSWECDVCMVKNEVNKQKCMACGTLKPNKDLTGFSFRLSNEKNSIAATTSSISALNSVTSSPTVSISSGLKTTSNSLVSSSVTSTLNSTTSFAPPTSISVTSCLSVLFSKASDSAKTSSKENSGSLLTSTMTNPSLKTSTAEHSSGSNFGVPLSDTVSHIEKPAFQFSSEVSTHSSWECPSCKLQNDGDKQTCKSCNAGQSSKNLTEFLTSTTPSTRIQTTELTCTSTPAFKFGSSSAGNNITAPPASNNMNFSFSAKKELATQLSSTTSLDKTVSKPVVGGFCFPATTSTTTTTANANPAVSMPVFQFNSTIKPDSSWECSNCLVKNEKDKQICSSCNKPQTVENAPDSIKTSKPQTIGLQSNSSTTSAPVFQFGNQSSITSSATSSFSTVNSTFTFGEKKDPNHLPTSSQTLAATHGSTSQSIFGGSAAGSLAFRKASDKSAASPLAFGKASDKPAANPLSFGKASDKPAANPLSFGNTSDKPAASGLTFGKSTDKPATGLFSFGAAAPNTTTKVFQFGSTTQSDSSLWECSNCHVKNDSEKQKCISCDSAQPMQNTSGFTFKGSNEIKSNTNSMVFNTPATTTSATPGFTFNASVPASTSPFVFGAKAESAVTTSSMFTFGTASAATSKPAATGFETQSSTPVQSFQFGSQSAGTNATASTFGAGSSSFSFGAKTGTPNPIQPTSVTQTPTPAFGSAPSQNPLFGNSITSPAFGKQAPGGFNFGLPTTSNAAPVFQFGAPEKKPATNSGFSFGTPSQDAANFQPQFNVNTPPSFNFGASSASGPFQFATLTATSPVFW